MCTAIADRTDHPAKEYILMIKDQSKVKFTYMEICRCTHALSRTHTVSHTLVCMHVIASSSVITESEDPKYSEVV